VKAGCVTGTWQHRSSLVTIAGHMKLEVLRLLGNTYAIFEVAGRVYFSRGVEDHLRGRGLSEQQIKEAIEGLNTEPRQMRLTVSR
jgi:hypothetical protein